MGSPGSRLAVPESLEVFLEHHGIKGMKWGIRRSKAQLARANPKKDDGPEDVTVTTRPGARVKTSGGRRQTPSEDAITVATLRQKAASSTTDSLSNRELKALVERMNLEKQYNNLAPDTRSRGKKFIDDMWESELSARSKGEAGGLTKNIKTGAALADFILEAKGKDRVLGLTAKAIKKAGKKK